MTKAYLELKELQQRSQVFLQKLKVKANELEAEALSIAQSVYDEDTERYKRAFYNFELGIKGQFKSIRDKANEIYKKQIMPRRGGWDSQGDYCNLYNETAQLFQDFDNEIQNQMYSIFDSVQKISPEVYLKQALDEYEQVKDAFSCSQCGAPIHIDQLYFVSTYIPCPYCKTQNTFVPSTRMGEVEGLTREVGEERHKDLERIYGELKSEQTAESLWAYFKYRAFVWLEKSKILPVFKDENLKVFYREVHDEQGYSHNYNYEKHPEIYQKIVEKLGFEQDFSEKVQYATESEKSVLKSDWDLMLYLSLGYLEKIGDFGKYQTIYQQNHERLTNLKSNLNEL